MEMKPILITLDADVLYMMRLTIQEAKGLVFCPVQQDSVKCTMSIHNYCQEECVCIYMGMFHRIRKDIV